MADRLQPRNDREQRLVDETLRDAEEIRAARRKCDVRAMLISPNYTPEQKVEAKAWLDSERRLRELMHTRAADDLEDVHSSVSGLFLSILWTGTPAAEELAVNVYRLALAAWERNRRETPDPDPSEGWDERNTASHFGYLVEAIERAEQHTRPAGEEGGR